MCLYVTREDMPKNIRLKLATRHVLQLTQHNSQKLKFHLKRERERLPQSFSQIEMESDRAVVMSVLRVSDVTLSSYSTFGAGAVHVVLGNTNSSSRSRSSGHLYRLYSVTCQLATTTRSPYWELCMTAQIRPQRRKFLTRKALILRRFMIPTEWSSPSL